MERGKKNKILELIREIEQKNSEIEKYVSSLSVSTRNESLKEIMNNIIEKNKVLLEIEGSKGPHLHSGIKESTNLLQKMVESFLLKIQENPAKKIIYLREFLDNFKSISNKDKDVIINSLQDEENVDKLKEEMTSLVAIFL